LERHKSDSAVLPVPRQKSPAAAQRKVSSKDMTLSALPLRSERPIPRNPVHRHESDSALSQPTRKAMRKDTLIPSSAHPVDASSSEAKRSSWHLPKDQPGFMTPKSPRSARWSTTNSMRALEPSPTPTMPTSYVVGPAPFTQKWWENITEALETSGLAENDCHIISPRTARWVGT
jgi:hypothetical protein